MAEERVLRVDAADLRLRAEETTRGEAALWPENIAQLSPEEAERMVHELRVHQIELEMQNEELRRTQVELANSRAAYVDLYDLAPVGYCTVSEQGLILEANLGMAGLLAVVRSALIKLPFSRFIVPEDEDVYYLCLKKLFASGAPQLLELRLARKGSLRFWALLEATTAYGADGMPVCHVVVSDITERKQKEEALHAQSEQLRALSGRLQQIREEERTMVARNLHDQIGQILTAIKMDVDWVAKRLSQDQAGLRDRLVGTCDLVRNAIHSVRRICSELRPGVLDDLGLSAAIEWQAAEFASRTGIQCSVSVPSDTLALDADRSTAIFRILQEALTNVARHAEAKAVRASLTSRNGSFLLMVQDDGKGIRDGDLVTSKGSLGLLGMKERAQACGGELHIWGEAGAGTTLVVEIPGSAAKQQVEDNAHFDI